MRAKILSIVSKQYKILLEDHTIEQAIVMGKIRLQMTPSTGDEVEVEVRNGVYTIEKILPRKNHLIRPSVSNVDQALIVMSMKDPDFSSTLIDRLSFLIMHADIEPVLIVTKIDKGIPEDFQKQIDEYRNGQMKVICTEKGKINEELKELLKGKISVLTGQSGAGKSSLLNTLDPAFHLATQEISKALGRGKHTTRHNELHEVAGGLVCDTPGFSALDFSHIEASELASCVPDFRPYLTGCKFNDCVHQNEPGCVIKKCVEEGRIPQRRYDHYLEVLQMIQERKQKYL